MLEFINNKAEIFPDRPGTSGQVDDEGVSPDYRNTPAQHGAFGDSHAVHAHGFGNAGDDPLRHRHSRLGHIVPGGKTRAACRQDQISETAVADPSEFIFKPFPIVGKQGVTGLSVPRGACKLPDQRTAQGFPFSFGTLVA